MNPDWIPFPHVLAAITQSTRSAGVDVLPVGATARDIAPAADGHARTLRATNGVDVAVAVADEAAFQALIDRLHRIHPDIAHRFLIEGLEVDVIPFGGIERQDRTIVWADGTTMNTMGFAQALESALHIRLPGGLTFPVASLRPRATWAQWLQANCPTNFQKLNPASRSPLSRRRDGHDPRGHRRAPPWRHCWRRVRRALGRAALASSATSPEAAATP